MRPSVRPDAEASTCIAYARDELTFADARELPEAAGDRRRIAHAGDVVQQPCLPLRDSPRRARAPPRHGTPRAPPAESPWATRAPAAAEFLFRECEAEWRELAGLPHAGLGRGRFVAGTRRCGRELGEHEATRPVEPAVEAQRGGLTQPPTGRLDLSAQRRAASPAAPRAT